ncbi:MAG: NAD(P)-dependent oxidoreductase [Clostridiales bacterium]|nr:NAD(P)-dependent oxidoreductase [Clostridiales bacterium]
MPNKMTVLITGCAGMIGSSLSIELLNKGYSIIGIDRKKCNFTNENFIQIVCELYDFEKLANVFDNYKIDRVIHLAALAHTSGEKDLSYNRYFDINVNCSKNIFNIAAKHHIPVLFASTVDVYGFVDGIVTNETIPSPVTIYGKTKYLAECELKNISANTSLNYTIFRFAPVYSKDIKRDIQKRYYLKYPHIAYVVGKGTEYEVLSIENAIKNMIEWIENIPQNKICNIKDPTRLNTAECIENEIANGKAKIVIHFPRWLVFSGFNIIKFLIGKNKYTYLLNKVVNPLITKE